MLLICHKRCATDKITHSGGRLPTEELLAIMAEWSFRGVEVGVERRRYAERVARLLDGVGGRRSLRGEGAEILYSEASN